MLYICIAMFIEGLILGAILASLMFTLHVMDEVKGVKEVEASGKVNEYLGCMLTM